MAFTVLAADGDVMHLGFELPADAVTGLPAQWLKSGGGGVVGADPVAPPAEPVVAYIDEAIGKIRANALHADRVDWERARNGAFAVAGSASEPAAAHASVAFLLSQLGDGHSRFQPPAAVRELRENRDTGGFGIESRQIGATGYVSIPAFTSINADRGKAFASDILSRLEQMAPSTCGWIVDLRKDSGGNMYPMIAGLAPFLGDGTLGYFLGRSDKTPWTLGEFVKGIGLAAPERLAPLRDAPVAVLFGPRTSSSGEAVLISFIGRANTRTFGGPSAGLSTGNRGIAMSDGAMLIITTVVMADRSGHAYGERITPDESVTWERVGGDGTLDAARAWLDGQPACATKGRKSD